MKRVLICWMLSVLLLFAACSAPQEPGTTVQAAAGTTGQATAEITVQSTAEATVQATAETTGQVTEEAAVKQEMRLAQGETGIYGNLYSPGEFDRTNTYPLIIMSHSANVNSDTLDSYARRSAALGYLVYTFDYPGGSTSRSDAVESSTVFTQMETLSFLVDHFCAQSYVGDVYLFGTSQGGMVSAVIADRKADAVSGLILLYPAFNIPELMSKFPIGVDPEYKKQLEEYNVYEHIGSFSGDVLILHGTADIMVPCSCSEKAAGLYPSCRLELISGANHGFNRENYAFTDKYDGVTWDFIGQYLTGHKEQ